MAVNFVRHVFGRWPATDILVGGGGARNVYLMERIAANLHRLDPRRDVPVHPLDDIGFDDGGCGKHSHYEKHDKPENPAR